MLNIKGKNKIKLSITQKASFAYIISGVLSRSINLITIPFFTRMLNLEEMGITTTFSSWQNILYAITSLSLGSGTISAAMVTFKNERDRYMSATLALSTLSSVLFSIIILWGRNYWENITSMPKSVIPIMLLYFWLQPALDFWYAKNKFENRYIGVFVISFLTVFFSGLFSVICVYILKEYQGVNLGIAKLYSQYIIIFIIDLLLYILIFYKGKCFFDKKMWQWSISVSWPLVIHSLSKNLLDISDRIMIANMRGNAEAAIYGTVYTICNVLLILWTAINSAIIPYIFESIEKNTEKQMEKKIITVIAAFGIISIIASLFSPEILKLLTAPEYYTAITIMPVLFSSIFLTSIYNVYGNFLLYKTKTKFIMLGTMLAVFTNVILNLFLLPYFGYKAASYTTLISSIVLSLSQAFMSKIVYKKHIISIKKIMYVTSGTIILSLMCILVHKHMVVRLIALGVLLILVIRVGRSVLGEQE